MNILVVNGYVRENKGDAALMSVLCEELQSLYPQATIKISSQEDPHEHDTFESWQNIGSFNRYCFDPATSKMSHLGRLFLCGGAAMALVLVPKRLHSGIMARLPSPLRRVFMEIYRADLVVSMGGGYLNGNASLMAHACIFLMLAPLFLAKRFQACAVCAPQSFGPFATALQRWMVAETFKRIDLVLTREEKTRSLLGNMSSEFPVVSSVDSGFLFTVNSQSNLRERLHVSHDKLLVGVTVRRWLDTDRQNAYEMAVAQTIDHLVSQYDAAVAIIPQVTSSLGGDDDRLTAQSVHEKVSQGDAVYVLDEEFTHRDIKSLYNELDFIMGTRFHSVIFSLTSLVPALAIEYEHKTSGIMHDLGLDDWVVKIEDASPRALIAKIDALIESRDDYVEHLRKVLPAYTDRAKKASHHIWRAYEAP